MAHAMHTVKKGVKGESETDVFAGAKATKRKEQLLGLIINWASICFY